MINKLISYVSILIISFLFFYYAVYIPNKYSKPITGEHAVMVTHVNNWDSTMGYVDLSKSASYSINTSTDSLTVNGVTHHNWRSKDSIKKINFEIDYLNKKLQKDGFYNPKNPIQTKEQFLKEVDSVYNAGGGIIK